MALVYRNGRPYLYRSKRRGGRVTSEYVGSGETARLIGAMEAMEAVEREDARSLDSDERKQVDDLEKALDELVGYGRKIAHEALTAAGFHRHHRGDWRRRRVDRHRESGPG